MVPSEERHEIYGQLETIYEDALSLFKERQDEYGDRWKEEEFKHFIQNIQRKATGLKGFFDSGIPNKRTRENLLDLINYTLLTIWRMDKDENLGS